MMENSNILILGNDYDLWYGYEIKEPVAMDISLKTNSHILISGMSGSGKSYCESILFARFAIAAPDAEYYFADYKQEDAYAYLQGCPHYYPYNRTLEAFNVVYDKLQKRLSGEDKNRHGITLIWDEYVANMLSLINSDKKLAMDIMNKVSEMLMLGRSLSVRLVCSCQRPDASVFPSGSRLNFGIILILGASIRSIYEMLIPKEYIDVIGERKLKVGEGVVLLQGSKLQFIKIPMVRNMDKMKQVCIDALTK